MKKAGSDTKVKKTLIRNYEQKIRTDKKTVQVSSAGSSKEKPCTKIQTELDHPKLCSSEKIANYLSDIRKSEPPQLSLDDLQATKAQLSAKITKKLNFHFNDHIYKNLVELNSDIANVKSKKDKKLNKNINTVRKDQEPNIEDFCNDEKEDDLIPNIPVMKHKFRPIRNVEQGHLHRLVSSFEKL